MEDMSWLPEGVDVTKPNSARIWDYALGGTHNFKVDREAAEQIWALMPPNARKLAWINRAWFQRAVRHCLEDGVSQFLDLGAGLPTRGSVHETAQAVDPTARVVYVDVDLVAFAHSRKMLEDVDHVGVVHADLRDVDKVLNDPVTTRILDFDQPVALIMSSVLPFIPDSDDPAGLIRRYAERMVSGSYLVMDQISAEEEGRIQGVEAFNRVVTDVVVRTRAETAALFAGFELVEPGVTWLEDWPLEPGTAFVDPPTRFHHGGIGRRP